MNFVHPGLLLGLGLASIPVVIYLLNRQRFRTVRWAAMDFILSAKKKHHRRLLLENILLLLVRTAAVAALVMALARPEGEGVIPGITRMQRNMAFVVDRSWSMGYQAGAGNLFDRAVTFVEDVLAKQLRDGDRVVVMVYDGDSARSLTPDPVFLDASSARKLLDDLREAGVGTQRSSLGPAMQELLKLTGRFHHSGDDQDRGAPVPVEAFVLTDMQRNQLLEDDHLRDKGLPDTMRSLGEKGVRIRFVDLSLEQPANASIIGLEPEQDMVGTGVPLRFNLTIANQSAAAIDEVRVGFTADGVAREEKQLALAAGETKVLGFYHSFFEPGYHQVGVTLATDPLLADNSRSRVLRARDRIDLLIVDGEESSEPWDGETDVLEAVLAPESDGSQGNRMWNLALPTVVNEAFLSETLKPYDVVILANVGALADEQVDRLEAWVRDGGSLVVYLGDQVSPEFYNRKFWRKGEGWLPARLGRVAEAPQEGGYRLEFDNYVHPITKFFEVETYRSGAQQARFQRYYQVEASAEELANGRSRVLARYSDHDRTPALIERGFGRGRVLLSTSTADSEWNSFAVNEYYAVLVMRMIHYLASAGETERNLKVGEPFELTVLASDYAGEVDLVSPDGEKVTKHMVVEEGSTDRFRLSHAETSQPGVYGLYFRNQGGGDRTEYFAVNVDVREGDLLKIEAEELPAFLPGVHAQVHSWKDRSELFGGSQGRGPTDEYWTYLIVILLGLLLLESFLGQYFSRF